MRLRLMLCIILPVGLLFLGAGILFYAHHVSDTITQPLTQVEALALEGRFDDAAPLLTRLDAYWDRHSDLLMLVVDHETIDSVSLELGALLAGATAHSAADTCIAVRRLRVHAQHLFRRDLPIPANLL